MNPVTISTSDKSRHFTAVYEDASGNAIPASAGVGYTQPIWAADDNGALVSVSPDYLAPSSVLPGGATVTMAGAVGTFNLTATAKKTGAPDLVGAVTVTIDGPVPSQLGIGLDPLPPA